MADQKRYVPESDAALVLSDGRIFRGRGFGADTGAVGDVVFTTAMTGYQEVCTDPAFRGQIVCMTYPIIGNYGVTADDDQTPRPGIAGLVVREIATQPSNWHMEGTLDDYLKVHGIPGISEVDTRALTRHIRSADGITGVVVRRAVGVADAELVERAKQATRTDDQPVGSEDLEGGEHEFGAGNSGPHLVVLDHVVRKSLIRSLTRRGARVTVIPYDSSHERVKELQPDGVVASGAGEAADSAEGVALVRSLLDDGRPYLGIGLGHQVLARVIGAGVDATGRRGGNQAIRDERSGRVTMTAQSTGSRIEPESVPVDAGWRVRLRNLSDGSVAGLSHDSLPALSVQFNPEGVPGPGDTGILFDEFLEMISGTASNDGGRE